MNQSSEGFENAMILKLIELLMTVITSYFYMRIISVSHPFPSNS